MARGAHRALLAGVDVDVLVGAAPIRELVDVRQREAGGRAGAAGAPRFGIERRQHAVGADAGLDPRRRGRTVAGGEMLFLAIEHQLDRRVRLFRQPCANQPLRVRGHLAAEAAAHVLRDHANVCRRDVQAAGEPLARGADPLRRHPRRQVIAVPFADGTVRLEAHVRDDVGRVRLFEDECRLLEPGGDVARLLRRARSHVAAVEHGGCVARERLIDDGDMRQDVVLDLDQARGVDRALFRVGRDSGNFVTLVHHGVALGVCRITPHDRRLDPRRSLRSGEIDRQDLRVRVRGTDDASVQHAGTLDVEGVFRAAGDFLRAVEPLDVGAEHRLRLRPRVLGIRWRRRRLRRPASSALIENVLFVSHAPPPSRWRRLRRCGRTCRSGRCSRRGPVESVPASASDSFRAGRRSP